MLSHGYDLFLKFVDYNKIVACSYIIYVELLLLTGMYNQLMHPSSMIALIMW